MQLIVDPIQRYAKMRAHTATHLLHAELAKIFPNTKQAGSLVDEDYLRFDYYTERMLSDEEIRTIETQVNTIIRNACTVSIEEMPKSEAELLGAKMFFEDKYGDRVRVVKIIQDSKLWIQNFHNPQSTILNLEFVSVELCGGTHVENTKDIGAFVIIWQQAVASGIKRIMAYTGPRVLDQYQSKNKQLSLVANTLECDVAQIQEKLEKVVSDYLTLQLTLTNINQNLLLSAKYEERTSNNNVSYNYLELWKWALKSVSVKDFQQFAKWSLKEETLAVDVNGWFCIVSPSGRAKQLMAEFGRKGGGSDLMCQGKIS